MISRAILSSAASGLEYLLGWTTGPSSQPEYHARWAFDPAAEKAAFEAFIDFVMERWERFPDLHIYHFAPYEPAALKRLMGRYATRESELDRLLRGERFVDLHAVARQAVRASVEQYSLKDLEVFYGFEREAPLLEASLALRTLAHAIELGRRDAIPEQTISTVETYNRDDCVSTMRLRDWLEELRTDSSRRGKRFQDPSSRPVTRAKPLMNGSNAYRNSMIGLPAMYRPIQANGTPNSRRAGSLRTCSTGTAAKRRRRGGSTSACSASPMRSLLEEKAALAGLEFVERVATPKRSVVDRYRFPPQECEIREGDKLRDGQGQPFGEVEAIDVAACYIDIRKGPKFAGGASQLGVQVHQRRRCREA